MTEYVAAFIGAYIVIGGHALFGWALAIVVIKGMGSRF